VNRVKKDFSVCRDLAFYREFERVPQMFECEIKTHCFIEFLDPYGGVSIIQEVGR
jgi:hypothetical protein